MFLCARALAPLEPVIFSPRQALWLMLPAGATASQPTNQPTNKPTNHRRTEKGIQVATNGHTETLDSCYTTRLNFPICGRNRVAPIINSTQHYSTQFLLFLLLFFRSHTHTLTHTYTYILLVYSLANHHHRLG